MAIRFNCVACSQPIEVDDEWAMKTVACPYCRRTMTAPRESILSDLTQIPTAKPLAPATMVGSDMLVTAGPAPMIYEDSNRYAVIAMAFAATAIMLIAASVMIFLSHPSELSDFQKAVQEGKPTMEAVRRFMEAHNGMLPTWFVVAGFLEIAAIGAVITSVVCGIIGLRVPRRRGLAVTALILSGGFMLLFCSGLVSSLGTLFRPITT